MTTVLKTAKALIAFALYLPVNGIEDI